MTHITGLITPRITTDEPASKGCEFGPRLTVSLRVCMYNYLGRDVSAARTKSRV